MPPVGFEPTISAGERPVGLARKNCSEIIPCSVDKAFVPVWNIVPDKHTF